LIPRAAYHARVWLIFRSQARFRPKIFFFTEKAVTTIRESVKRADEFSGLEKHTKFRQMRVDDFSSFPLRFRFRATKEKKKALPSERLRRCARFFSLLRQPL
jgi:hypothetical protein